jgi:hypothetical protein
MREDELPRRLYRSWGIAATIVLLLTAVGVLLWKLPRWVPDTKPTADASPVARADTATPATPPDRSRAAPLRVSAVDVSPPVGNRAGTALAAPATIAAVLAPPAAAPEPPPKPAVRYAEQVLSRYRKGAPGGFSPYWAAYVVRPDKQAKDPRSYFVDLNGQQLGPYDALSELFQSSADGKHIAFAARQGKQWWVVVDGRPRWSHAELATATFTWNCDLEGNSLQMQTPAALLRFSPQNDIAYIASNESGKWAMCWNGAAGPPCDRIDDDIAIVDGKPLYCGRSHDNTATCIVGYKRLGPYGSVAERKTSADGKHFCAAASAKGSTVFSILIVDGVEQTVPGELTAYVIGDAGRAALAYKSGQKSRVRFGRDDLPDHYDEVAHLTLSPDGRKLAYWARHGDKWTVYADGRQLPGFEGHYALYCGDEIYSILWSADGEHLAYHVRHGNGGNLVLDGRPVGKGVSLGGFEYGVIVDDQRHVVGAQVAGGSHPDRQALVEALLVRERTGCDPATASLHGRQLCWVEKGRDSGPVFVHVGPAREGPYRGIRSRVFSSNGARHYVYVVESVGGQQLVLDGRKAGRTYDRVQCPLFNKADDTLEFLAVRDGNVLHVTQPLAAAADDLQPEPAQSGVASATLPSSDEPETPAEPRRRGVPPASIAESPPSPPARPKDLPLAPPAAIADAEPRYEKADLAALEIVLSAHISSARMSAAGDGSFAEIDGVISRLTVAGKPLELASQRIVLEGRDAVIATKSLGKFKVTAERNGTLSLWLTAAQRQQLERMGSWKSSGDARRR